MPEFQPGFRPAFTVTDSIAADLTRIEQTRGIIDSGILPDSWVREAAQRALVLEAYFTTRLEGSHSTLEHAERPLGDVPVFDAHIDVAADNDNADADAGVDADDARRVLNYRGAYALALAHLDRAEPVSAALLRDINGRLVQGIRADSAQAGKSAQDDVDQRDITRADISRSGTAPASAPAGEAQRPPAELVAELVAWLNSECATHPVLMSGIAQHRLVRISPFTLGNGETARLFSVLCLYRAGYEFKRILALSEHYARDRAAFHQALRSKRGQEDDLTEWLEYFTRALATQLTEIKEQGGLVLRRNVLTEEHDLSKRQSEAVAHILEHGGLTIQDYERLYPNVSRTMLQQDLKEMIDRGLLDLEGNTLEGETYRLAYRRKRTL